MKTIFGLEWPVASGFEVFFIFALFGLIIAFFILFRYFTYLKDKNSHEEQFFNFKTKQLGLSNFQNKILLGVIRILRLKDYREILHLPERFEASIAPFLAYVHKKDESAESLLAICKDIVITYEKVYHHAAFRKPLDTLRDIEEGMLVYFQANDSLIYIGKIAGKDQSTLTLQIYREVKEEELLRKKVNVFVWRNGDAEYTFESTVSAIENGTVRILIPDVFNRGKEVRHPFLEVMLPCSLSWKVKAAKEPGEEPQIESVRGTIFKLNEHEIVVRLGNPISFDREYTVDFTLSDFKVRSPLKMMADSTISEENMHFYTFKFLELSPVANEIVKNYIIDHME